MDRLSVFAARYKYHAAVLVLLAAASVLSALMLAARMAVTETRLYLFLAWNLFLAWIPVIFSYFALAFSYRRVLLYVLVPIFAFLWLIFFPNAPYILTDLQHLALDTSTAPVWFDVLLLVWFSWTAMLLGLVSLYVMHNIVNRAFGRWPGWIFVLGVSLLTSLGVYLGRFVRLNSWDILHDPSGVALSILGQAVDPNLRSLTFTALLTVFFLFVYCTLYSFGHLLQEEKRALERRSGDPEDMPGHEASPPLTP
jgi:uncharacterized membrane protein